MKRLLFTAVAALVIGVLIGPYLRQAYQSLTSPPPDRLQLSAVAFADLPGWAGDDLAGLLPAFLRSCAVWQAMAPDRVVGPQPQLGTVADWLGPCAGAGKLAGAPTAVVRGFIEAQFQPLQVRNNRSETGLFTGYYEPELRGSRRRHGPYTVALLRPPPGLVSVNLGEFNPQWRGQRIAGRVSAGKLKPLQRRAEISAGALAGEKLELLYVDDPIDAFFLHIQGSGRVRLDDGGTLRLGYAGQNGHPYVAIGKVLRDSGALEKGKVSMQSIRAWLAAHPERVDEILNQNPSYVFFQPIKVADPALGPFGAHNVPLTPGRSLAVDLEFHALGAPMWLDTATPDGAPLRRLMVAQDTGGAIRGPVRGDVFWGFGPEAAQIAGRMQSRGKLYLLLPGAVAARLSGEDAPR